MVVCQIYKGGVKTEANNYRGINIITNTGYKIYGMILEKETEENNTIGDWQAGFRRGRRAIDNVYIIRPW